MKKHTGIMAITLLIIGFMVSCSKENEPAPKDYGTAIKDKTWWGTFAIPGQATEHYSVHFNADSSLKWSQLSGDYNGKWSINSNKLTMDFTTLGSKIKADITDDDKLINFVTTNSAVVNSCELIANPNIPLENTTWEGTLLFVGSGPASLTSFKISFKPGSLVDARIGSAANILYTYTRSASGGAIRLVSGGTTKHFGVVVSGKDIKGSYLTYASPWQVTKQ